MTYRSSRGVRADRRRDTAWWGETVDALDAWCGRVRTRYTLPPDGARTLAEAWSP
jgi:hypothetical protein